MADRQFVLIKFNSIIIHVLYYNGRILRLIVLLNNYSHVLSIIHNDHCLNICNVLLYRQMKFTRGINQLNLFANIYDNMYVGLRLLFR